MKKSFLALLCLCRVITMTTAILTSNSKNSIAEGSGAPDSRNPRELELDIIRACSKKKRIYVLTGAKSVGKTTLARLLAGEPKSSVLYIDLRALTSDREIKAQIATAVNTYIKESPRVDTKSSSSTGKASVGIGVVKAEFEMKNDATYKFSNKSAGVVQDTAAVTPASVDEAIDILKCIINKSFGFSFENLYRFLLRRGMPECIIFDEAQTLRLLEKGDLSKVLKVLLKASREKTISIVFVTSDYSAMMSFGNAQDKILNLSVYLRIVTSSKVNATFYCFYFDFFFKTGLSLIDELTPLTLGNLDYQSSSIFWTQGSGLFLPDEVHESCRGNIADMNMILENIDKGLPNAMSLAYQQSRISAYDTKIKDADIPTEGATEIFSTLLESTNYEVHLSSFPVHLHDSITKLVKANLLTIFHSTPMLRPVSDVLHKCVSFCSPLLAYYLKTNLIKKLEKDADFLKSDAEKKADILKSDAEKEADILKSDAEKEANLMKKKADNLRKLVVLSKSKDSLP